jgi:TRAP-type uncharacterized transport system substrate-binding protein
MVKINEGYCAVKHPYYIGSIIPGGMYADNPDDVPTIGTRAVLVSSSDQSDKLVYAMVLRRCSTTSPFSGSCTLCCRP